jgi:integrase
MTRVDLKGINTIRRRLASGERRTYYYHRATGLRLEGKPGSVEFLESWQAAERAIKATDRHEGTFAAWINGYRASDDFTLLADATRKDYLKQIAKIEAEFGDMPLAALRDPAVRAEFLDWHARLAKRGARQADYAMTVLGRVLSWVMNRGHLAVNPAARPGRRYKSARAEIVWRPDDVEAFLAKASPELALALVLARDTAQRQGDLLRLTWSAYDGANITLRQSKRGAAVSVPVTAELKRLLDAAPRRAVTILTTAEGLPWKADHFRHQWRAATLVAGLDGLRFNDLRGTCVTALADAGCTPAQIASVTGHSQRSVHAILDVYQARTKVQASAAIAKLERHFRKQSAKRLQNGATTA